MGNPMEAIRRQTIHESAREIPVLAEADVLVAGGGISGCAAALGAARAGARVILLERNGCLGGVATATLMANIGNHFLTWSGRQTLYGIAAEVVERLVAAGAASPRWRHPAVPGCTMDPERLKVILIEMLEAAGVTVLTHALAARPIMSGHRVCGCFLESKSGRQAVLATNTVDATGEIDLAYQAGADLVEHRGNCSLLFKVGGVDLDVFVAFLEQDPEGFPAGMDWVKDVQTFAANWRERGVFFFPHYGGKKWRFLRECIAQGEFTDCIPPAFNLDVLGMYSFRGRGTVVINSNYYIFEGLDVRVLSQYETHAQKMCYYVADFLKRKVPGFEKSYVEHIGVDLGLRGARYIRGRAYLREEQMMNLKAPVYFDDVIAVGVAQTTADGWPHFSDLTCDIPFGITVPQGVEHLLVGTGKAVSSDKEHKRIVRGMAYCMAIGQATGAAAALASRSGLSAGDVPIRDLQRELLRQGVWLGDRERLRQLGLA